MCESFPWLRYKYCISWCSIYSRYCWRYAAYRNDLWFIRRFLHRPTSRSTSGHSPSKIKRNIPRIAFLSLLSSAACSSRSNTFKFVSSRTISFEAWYPSSLRYCAINLIMSFLILGSFPLRIDSLGFTILSSDQPGTTWIEAEDGVADGKSRWNMRYHAWQYSLLCLRSVRIYDER